MIKRLAFILCLAITVPLVLESCKSTKQSSRKCDGRKGQRTPMGNI